MAAQGLGPDSGALDSAPALPRSWVISEWAHPDRRETHAGAPDGRRPSRREAVRSPLGERSPRAMGRSKEPAPLTGDRYRKPSRRAMQCPALFPSEGCSDAWGRSASARCRAMVKKADGAEALKKPSRKEGVLGDGNRTKKIQASRDFVFRPHFGRWEQLQPRRPAKKTRWKLQAAVGQ